MQFVEYNTFCDGIEAAPPILDRKRGRCQVDFGGLTNDFTWIRFGAFMFLARLDRFLPEQTPWQFGE
jgi:hypothetical protein